MEYVGERNAARMGTWERRITVTEVNRLRNRFEQMGFWQLKARYDGNVQDISGVYLSYAKGSRIKQVLNRDIENPPAAFPPLVAELEALVSSGEWTQPGTPTSPAPTPIAAPRPADEAKPVAPTKPGQQPAQPTMVPTKERRTRRE